MFKKSIAVVFAVLALSAGAVSAQSYMGATVGRSQADVDCSGTTSCSKSDTAFKVYGGINVAPKFDVEVGYFDLGSAKASDGIISAEIKSKGVEGAAVYRMDLNQTWGAFAKGGVAYIRAEGTASDGTVSGSYTENSFQPVLGAGLTYKVTESVRARADVDYHRVKFSGEKANVTSVSVGVEVKF
jgi:OOP family OmpA-OmpF porin